ncbi:MAG TPA: YceI family protein [Thermomicrobiales bacterium]|jgi:polyisoprenoid-binding protein YceI
MSAIAQTQTTWAIDASHSSVEFAVKHMMFTTVKGRFGSFQGTILADESNPANSSVQVTIDVNSIDTRDEKRDGHLRSADFFDAETYPQITFTSTRVESKGHNEFMVYGNLTVRDVTSEIAIPATFHGSGTTPFGTTVGGFNAELTINRKDFGLTWNVALETGGVLVSDNVKISLDIEAVKQ